MTKSMVRLEASGKLDVRSVSGLVLCGRLDICYDWDSLVKTYASSIDSELKGLSIDRQNCALNPGDIENLNCLRKHESMISESLGPMLSCLGLSSFNETELKRHQIQSSMLYCAGSKFHTDALTWSGDLFLNWYVGGPPRDFVLRSQSSAHRITIHPGDVFFFDPAMVHGLVAVGEDKFNDASFLPNDALASSIHSIFVSHVVPITTSLKEKFGISSLDGLLSGDLISNQGWIDILSIKTKINPLSGKITCRNSKVCELA